MELYSHNSAAVLTFPPGEGYPRLTRAVLVELVNILNIIERDKVFHGIVIAAHGESFATGADVEEIVKLRGIGAQEFARAGQAVFEKIARFPLPVVAAVRGYCLGGGLDLALACHARVATYDASFGHPGAALGLLTGWGGTQRLPRLIGKAQALHMLLTGDRVPATQALTLGMVDELVPSEDLIAAAARRAARSETRSFCNW
ncbi:MAG: enoyl-CoA hydratase/isomerase family protein [Acidobacteriia bacterium]|nr:enoyl-CoA hydratase/isomerase family protein [Terriglobia bacterium]